MEGTDPKIPDGMTDYGPKHPDYPDEPKDWDKGAYLCRDGGMYFVCGYGWGHGIGCWNPTASWDRIAYTTKQPEKDNG